MSITFLKNSNNFCSMILGWSGPFAQLRNELWKCTRGSGVTYARILNFGWSSSHGIKSVPPPTTPRLPILWYRSDSQIFCAKYTCNGQRSSMLRQANKSMTTSQTTCHLSLLNLFLMSTSKHRQISKCFPIWLSTEMVLEPMELVSSQTTTHPRLIHWHGYH